MRKKRSVFALVIFAVSFSLLHAQITRQTGAIRGTVVDQENVPIPGVTVTTTSPALMGSIADVTEARGNFRLVALPAGTYLVVAKLEGFKTIRREDIMVRTGMTVTINFTLEVAEIKEEVTVKAAAPTVDVQSTKIANVLTSEVMQKLPMNRKMNDAISSAAGLVGPVTKNDAIIHGATGNMAKWEVDGVSLNMGVSNEQFGSVQYDVIEEIEIVTGGLPASIGESGGSYINVVTKSGSNEFHGQAQAYYTGEKFAQSLYPHEQLSAMGIGAPVFPIYDGDFSGSLGGPVIKDKLWFFFSLGLLKKESYGNFIPTTILGTRYEPYNFPDTMWQGMLKLTARLSSSLRFFMMFHGELQNRDPSATGSKTTYDASWTALNNYRIIPTANLSWQLGAETIVDFRAGLTYQSTPFDYREGSIGKISYYDGYTGYRWNAPSPWSRHPKLTNGQASVRLTRFQDDFLGGDHEIGVGIEWVGSTGSWARYRKTLMDLDYYNGNIYYYRGLFELNGPHPIYGDGRISAEIAGPKGETNNRAYSDRYAGYIQDSMTIKKRLTINLGVRINYNKGSLLEGDKEVVDDVIKKIGDYVLTPKFGFNPYGPYHFDGLDNLFGWTSISPRLGASYDLFGDGKTALKVSYARYEEALLDMYFGWTNPLAPRTYSFYWWDLNGNKQVDPPGVDDYAYLSGDVKMVDPAYVRKTLNPDAKAPYYNEITASINHELFKDFRVTFQYLYKNKMNPIDDVLYDPDTGRYWYTYERAPEWWVPFTTVVPGIGEFKDQQVTLYFMSKNSPYDKQFTRLTNVPEAKRTYQAVELTFDKRYSNGWTLGGSIVWSVSKGNNSEAQKATTGWTGAYNQANWFVNRYGRTDNDVPLAVKLYGSFELHYGFVTSFYYTHFEGTPFTRTVTIYPPASWAAANNAVPWSTSVNVEVQGSRRNQSMDNIDFRLEKEFRLPIGKIGVFMDVLNLLGNRYVYVGMNPGGTWRPAAEKTVSGGTYTPAYEYGRVTSVSGTRIFKFSIRFTF